LIHGPSGQSVRAWCGHAAAGAQRPRRVSGADQDAAASPIIAADVRIATEISINRLDQGFFRVRFDRLTPREKNYLRAMAELGPGPHRSGQVAKVLGKPSSALGTLRDGLINKGMIYAPAYGDIAFTVPLFDDFMRRTMPTGLQ
jgi:hypothetical protein